MNNRKKSSYFPPIAEFASAAAMAIDRSYLNESGNYIGRAWNFTKILSIYVGRFLPSTVIDLVASGFLGMRYSALSFITADEKQKEHMKQQRKYATIFGGNLIALLAAPVGLWNPKLVTLNFIPQRPITGVSAGGGLHHLPNGKYKLPTTEDEIIAILNKAKSNGRKVMAVGAGRSQGKQFLPEGDHDKKAIVLDLSEFNTIKIDEDSKTATVGAGVCWIDLQRKANKAKLALQTMQASNVFNIAGSISTGIHGYNHRSGVLSNAILSMNIITADGEKKTVTPNDELFHLVTSGFGLFGIITSITLQLTDNEMLHEVGKRVAIGDYVNHFRENVITENDIRMHLFRLSLDPKNLLGTGVAVDYVTVKNQTDPVITPNFHAEGSEGTRFNRIMVNLARRIGFARKMYWKGEEDRLLANNAEPMSTNAIMQPPINAMFNNSVSEAEWLQEYFLPEGNLEAFIKEFAQILMRNEVPLINASVRFVKQHDKSYLCPAFGGDRFALVICFNQSLQSKEVIKAAKWLREGQELTVKMGGSYYLPYQHVSNPETFNASYPHAKEFYALKKKYDPDELFSSGLYQSYIVQKDPIVNYFKTMLASAESKKQFSGFLKKVLQRVDSNQLFNLLEDILKYKDTHAEIYSELCKRLPEITPSSISSFNHILTSLSDIKAELGEQAKLLLDGVKDINGLVEIGYPGRFIDGFKKNFNVTGSIIAVYEQPSITDYIQTGFPRPYNRYEKLDYNNPSLANLPKNSVDLITCYVGLHHFPEDKLDGFLKDIKRILRKGGHLLLVEHDINDDTLWIAHGAHMIFNAVTGETLKNEMGEIRNFHNVAYWREMLAKHDLCDATIGPDVPMIREGDPSLNRMVSFVKGKPKLVIRASNQEAATRSPANDSYQPQGTLFDSTASASAASSSNESYILPSPNSL